MGSQPLQLTADIFADLPTYFEVIIYKEVVNAKLD